MSRESSMLANGTQAKCIALPKFVGILCCCVGKNGLLSKAIKNTSLSLQLSYRARSSYTIERILKSYNFCTLTV